MKLGRGIRFDSSTDWNVGMLTPAQEKRLNHLIRYHNGRRKCLELSGDEPLKVRNARMLLQAHKELRRDDIPRSNLINGSTITHAELDSVLRDLGSFDLPQTQPFSGVRIFFHICRVFGVKIGPEIRLRSSHLSTLESIYPSRLGGGYSGGLGPRDTPGNYVA